MGDKDKYTKIMTNFFGKYKDDRIEFFEIDFHAKKKDITLTREEIEHLDVYDPGLYKKKEL